MEIDYKSIGRRISDIRKERGLTQQQLSEAANISNKYMSNVELNKSKVSLDVLNRICHALDITLDYIVNNRPDTADIKKIDELYEAISKLSRSDRDFVAALLETLNDKRNMRN